MAFPAPIWIDFEVKLPYPKIGIISPDPAEALLMLENIRSETEGISLYRRGSSLLKQNTDMAEIFRRIGMIEADHLSVFSSLAEQLGEGMKLLPEKECQQVLEHSLSFADPEKILRNALEYEEKEILTYRKQLREVRQKGIADLLRRILLDEQAHVSVLNVLLNSFSRSRSDRQ